jgi:hypothetical protein
MSKEARVMSALLCVVCVRVSECVSVWCVYGRVPGDCEWEPYERNIHVGVCSCCTLRVHTKGECEMRGREGESSSEFIPSRCQHHPARVHSASSWYPTTKAASPRSSHRRTPVSRSSPPNEPGMAGVSEVRCVVAPHRLVSELFE